jgi:hypothetical protein
MRLQVDWNNAFNPLNVVCIYDYAVQVRRFINGNRISTGFNQNANRIDAVSI